MKVARRTHRGRRPQTSKVRFGDGLLGGLPTLICANSGDANHLSTSRKIRLHLSSKVCRIDLKKAAVTKGAIQYGKLKNDP